MGRPTKGSTQCPLLGVTAATKAAEASAYPAAGFARSARHRLAGAGLSSSGLISREYHKRVRRERAELSR
jgi:hypothetical protein